MAILPILQQTRGPIGGIRLDGALEAYNRAYDNHTFVALSAVLGSVQASIETRDAITTAVLDIAEQLVGLRPVNAESLATMTDALLTYPACVSVILAFLAPFHAEYQESQR